MKTTFLLSALLMTSACASRGRPDIRFTPRTTGSGAAFSDAVSYGGLIFVAGQMGNDSTGRMAGGGIQGETRQAMENIRKVLARNGVGMERVLKCTVFLADINDWAAMNEVYVTFFPGNKPARSAVGDGALVRNGRVEIECIAGA